jgi:hypothetical protein
MFGDFDGVPLKILGISERVVVPNEMTFDRWQVP